MISGTDETDPVVDADLALNSFLRRYFADSASGTLKAMEQYQQLYPGHEAAIAEEFGRLDSADLAPESGAGRPRMIGPYRLIQELGRGGQGVVHLALDTKLNRRVALKSLTGLSAFSDELLKRFRREAEVASRIDHPGICTVFDAGEHDRVPYIAMRYLDGETL